MECCTLHYVCEAKGEYFHSKWAQSRSVFKASTGSQISPMCIQHHKFPWPSRSCVLMGEICLYRLWKTIDLPLLWMHSPLASPMLRIMDQRGARRWPGTVPRNCCAAEKSSIDYCHIHLLWDTLVGFDPLQLMLMKDDNCGRAFRINTFDCSFVLWTVKVHFKGIFAECFCYMLTAQFWVPLQGKLKHCYSNFKKKFCKVLGGTSHISSSQCFLASAQRTYWVLYMSTPLVTGFFWEGGGGRVGKRQYKSTTQISWMLM